MYKFYDGLYTDVRIEDVSSVYFTFNNETLENLTERSYKAAFVRVYDGGRWHYASTTDIESIQDNIDMLSKMAAKNGDILNLPMIKKFEINRDSKFIFKDNNINNVPVEEKIDLIKGLFPSMKALSSITIFKSDYMNVHKIKRFISSLGTDVSYDYQNAGFALRFDMMDGENRFSEAFQIADIDFNKLKEKSKDIDEFLKKCDYFLKNSIPCDEGEFTAILSPMAAGIFAHESFGHKSEADFMVGDETMKREWAIGTKVGSDILTIIDDGNLHGSGYTPYDDEGQRAQKTYLIKNGKLRDRLHSAATAAELNESVTGNARAVNYEYEPIVRMTSTYIERGSTEKEDLFKSIQNGYYIESVKHGSGMSTFTMAPSLAYKIEGGKITDPVRISVISGNVFKTLNDIDGLSDDFILYSFVMGGCGKIEQFPLPVGFGGPYVRVNNISVR